MIEINKLLFNFVALTPQQGISPKIHARVTFFLGPEYINMLQVRSDLIEADARRFYVWAPPLAFERITKSLGIGRYVSETILSAYHQLLSRKIYLFKKRGLVFSVRNKNVY